MFRFQLILMSIACLYHVSIHRHVIKKSLMNVRKLKKRPPYRYSSLVLLLKAPAGKFCNLFLDRSLETNQQINYIFIRGVSF